MTAAATARERLKQVPGMVRVVRSGRDARRAAANWLEDVRWKGGRVMRKRRIAGYLRAHEVRKLQLGTGANPYEGWLNTDVEEWPVGESGDPRLAGLERHMRSAAEFNAYETMVLEARRP